MYLFWKYFRAINIVGQYIIYMKIYNNQLKQIEIYKKK